MPAEVVELGSEWHTETGAGWRLHHDAPDATASDFATSVAAGLRQTPRTLDCRWLYDAEGSALYERITETEEYYPTRTEDSILAEHAGAIRDLVGPCAVVELGSGSSTKTRHLLDAWTARGEVVYAPIDVSASALRGASEALADRYEGARIEALASTYGRGLGVLRALKPKMVVFLGSTLGNYDRPGAQAFLTEVAETLQPGDHLLLGIDRVKPRPVLEAAYDDAAGWTRRFILNLFERMNRELGTQLSPDAMRYEARWNAEAEQVEMWVHAREAVAFDVSGERIELAADEPILVEISRKFRPERVAAMAARAGLELRGEWSDPKQWFTEQLYRKAGGQ